MTHEERLKEVITLLEEKGYNPVAQLTGYIKTGRDDYITRHGGARDKIKNISIDIIEEYIKNMDS